MPTAWAELLGDLSVGKFDVGMGGISITLSRQRTALFSAPVMRVGKTPIARCGDQGRFASMADIDRASVRVITNPGGTNERFDRANLKQAEIVVFLDNSCIFDALAVGQATS